MLQHHGADATQALEKTCKTIQVCEEKNARLVQMHENKMYKYTRVWEECTTHVQMREETHDLYLCFKE